VVNPITQYGKTFETALQHIFPAKQEETRIQKARLIMGDDIKDLSDEDLDVYLTNFQYLIDSWLDEYEKQVFDNKTLKEIMNNPRAHARGISPVQASLVQHPAFLAGQYIV